MVDSSRHMEQQRPDPAALASSSSMRQIATSAGQIASAAEPTPSEPPASEADVADAADAQTPDAQRASGDVASGASPGRG